MMKAVSRSVDERMSGREDGRECYLILVSQVRKNDEGTKKGDQKDITEARARAHARMITNKRTAQLRVENTDRIEDAHEARTRDQDQDHPKRAAGEIVNAHAVGRGCIGTPTATGADALTHATVTTIQNENQDQGQDHPATETERAAQVQTRNNNRTITTTQIPTPSTPS